MSLDHHRDTDWPREGMGSPAELHALKMLAQARCDIEELEASMSDLQAELRGASRRADAAEKEAHNRAVFAGWLEDYSKDLRFALRLAREKYDTEEKYSMENV